MTPSKLKDLKQIKEKVLSLIQADGCDPTIRAWSVGSYLSFHAAGDLGYEHDDFHQHAMIDPNRRWARATLLNVVQNNLQSIYPDDPTAAATDSVLWLRGYYYNTALMRMSALYEKGLRLLWRRVNGTDPEDVFGKGIYKELREWYVKDFLNSDESRIRELEQVRRQVNEFKHEEAAETLSKVESWSHAVTVFQQLFALLEFIV
jgi:hypothetical protein